MAKKKIEEIMVTEHIFETRYVASGSFLDLRGYIADYILSSDLFRHWRIEQNVIHFHDEDGGIKKDGAFVGYKNAGYQVYNSDTTNYFQDKTISFWNTLRKNTHFKIPAINRVGVRTKVFLNCEMDFERIKSNFIAVFFAEKALKPIGGTLEDLSITMDMKEGGFDYKITLGPIHNNEAKNYFSFDTEHFKEAGIFLDIDFFKSGEIKDTEIPALIKAAMTLKWKKIEDIAEALGL